MPKEEKMNYTDLVVLFEQTKDKIKEAGLRCDTMHMSPKVCDLIMAGLKNVAGLEKMPFDQVMFVGLKIIKHKDMPENTVVFSHQGKVRRIEDWELRGVNNGNSRKAEKKNKEKESTKKC